MGSPRRLFFELEGVEEGFDAVDVGEGVAVGAERGRGAGGAVELRHAVEVERAAPAAVAAATEIDDRDDAFGQLALGALFLATHELGVGEQGQKLAAHDLALAPLWSSARVSKTRTASARAKRRPGSSARMRSAN